jgi:DNA primase
VEREVYSHKTADMAKVSADAVLAEAGRLRRIMRVQAKKKQETELSRPARMQQPKEKSLRYENVRSAAAEKGILRLLYFEPDIFDGAERLSEDDFSVPLFGRMFSEIRERAKDGAQPPIAILAGSFTGEEISLLTEILNEPPEIPQSGKALDDYIDIIKTEKLLKRQPGTDDGSELLELARKLRQSKGYGG